jgi:hypothetical protein
MAAEFQQVPLEIHTMLVASKSAAAVRPQRPAAAQQAAADADPPLWHVTQSVWEGQLDAEAAPVVLQLRRLLPAKINSQSLDMAALRKEVSRFQVSVTVPGQGAAVVPMLRVMPVFKHKASSVLDVVLMADKTLMRNDPQRHVCPEHMVIKDDISGGLPHLLPADLYRLRFRVEPRSKDAEESLWMGLGIATWLLDAAGGIVLPHVFEAAVSEARAAAAAEAT